MRPSSLDTLQGTLAARRNHDAGALDDKLWPRPITSPADDDGPAQHITQPPGFEGVDVCATPRPAIAPPKDDRLDVIRRFVVDCCWDSGRANAARVLAQRSPLGDAEAWEAVGNGLRPDFRVFDDVCNALGRGDLDAAAKEAAKVCGDLDAEGRPDGELWLREVRAEQARKGGAR